MSNLRGGIAIGGNVMIAANVQLLTNNHDLYDRSVLLCRPIVIGQGARIGAGATAHQCVHSAVRSCRCVRGRHKGRTGYAVVIGSPVKVVRTLDAERFPPWI